MFTASLWVTAQILADRFGLHKFPYGNITQYAFSPSSLRGHGVQNEWKFSMGRTPSEIREALLRTGSSVKLIGPTDPDRVSMPHSPQARMRLLTYTFVESGLPIIACYYNYRGGHAVTLVGHLLPDGLELEDGAAAEDIPASSATLSFGNRIDGLNARGHRFEHHMLGQIVQLYYCHNDNYGPFDRLQILPHTQSEQLKSAVNADPKWPSTKPIRENAVMLLRGRQKGPGVPEEDQLLTSSAVLNALICPLPPYVQSSPFLVIRDALKLFNRFLDVKPDWVTVPDSADSASSKGRCVRILWRCLMASAPDFKRSLIRRRYPVEIVDEYLKMHLPLYVWLLEFSVGQESSLGTGCRRAICGEFLYDPTRSKYEPACLAVRMQGRFAAHRDIQCLKRVCRDSAARGIGPFVPVETR